MSFNSPLFTASVMALLALMAMFLPAIEQSHSYHQFAGDGVRLGIPNAMNVLSNLPMFFVGLWGLVLGTKPMADSRIWKLAVSFMLVAIGSAYYHLHPMVSTLFWDRLPMGICFGLIIVVFTSDFMSKTWTKRSHNLVLAFCVFGVIHWRISEFFGPGNLNLYMLSQLVPMLTFPFLLIYNPYKRNTMYLVLALLAYALAKAFEMADGAVLELTSVIGGHPIKHILAALAMAFILKHLIHSTQKTIS